MDKLQASYRLAFASDNLTTVTEWAEDLDPMPELLLQELDEALASISRARHMLLNLEV